MPVDDLIDERTGIITSVARQPADPRMPAFWAGWGATTARIDRALPWSADGFGFGAALGNDQGARGAAVGEAIERYCGNALPANPRLATWQDITAAGDDAIDPHTLALYSQKQYATPGFPFRPFTRDLRTAWVEGEDLLTGKPVWVPFSLVFLDTRHGAGLHLPPVHSLSYSGIAAGPTRNFAERNAIEELMERDACTVWWRSGATTREITGTAHLTAQLGRSGFGDLLRIRLLEIPSDLPAPVVAAFIEQGRELIAFGAACRATPEAASIKALVESVGLLQVTRQLTDPTGDVWRAVAAGHIPAHVYLPYRADRTYLDAAETDFRNITDLPAIAQLYLDPRMQQNPLQRLRPPATVPLSELRRVDDEDSRGRYITDLTALGHRVVSVDVTTPDVHAAGLTVVRVVVPGLVGNAPPAFPLSGSPRLLDVPRNLAWDVRPASTDDLVATPLPLA